MKITGQHLGPVGEHLPFLRTAFFLPDLSYDIGLKVYGSTQHLLSLDLFDQFRQ